MTKIQMVRRRRIMCPNRGSTCGLLLHSVVKSSCSHGMWSWMAEVKQASLSEADHAGYAARGEAGLHHEV